MENLLIISHEVKNFDTWKTAFESGETMRADAGITTKGIYLSPEKTNWVTVITQTNNPETAKAFLSNPELQAAMKEAGVISAPEIKFLASVN